MEQFKRLDFIGTVLFIGGLATFLIGLSWGGQSYPWKSAPVIATIIVGAVALVAFVLWEAYGHKGDPLMPLHLFKSPGYLAMILTAMVGSCVYYSMNVIWPQQIAYLFGGTSLHRGWLACVVGSATLLGQIAGAILCRYIPESRYILMTSCAALLAFSGAMISIGPGDETKGIALMFMACFSVGVIEMCSLALAPLACPPEDLGVATGALGSIRSGGAAVALAIYTTILSNKLTEFIPKYVGSAVVEAGLPQSSVATFLENFAAGTLETMSGLTNGITEAAIAAQASAAAEAFK